MLKTLTTVLIIASVTATAAVAETVSIGTGGQGSMQYTIGTAIAKVVSEDHGLKFTVVPQGGPVVTVPMTNSGETQFGLGVGLVAVYAHRGVAMFKDRPQKDMRLAAILIPNRMGLYVRKDLGITSIDQVKGKRLASSFVKQKILVLFTKAMLAMGGMSYEDVKSVPVPDGVRQIDEFIAGNIDVAMWTVDSGKTLQADAAVGGINVLSLPNTPKAVAAMS